MSKLCTKLIYCNFICEARKCKKKTVVLKALNHYACVSDFTLLLVGFARIFPVVQVLHIIKLRLQKLVQLVVILLCCCLSSRMLNNGTMVPGSVPAHGLFISNTIHSAVSGISQQMRQNAQNVERLGTIPLPHSQKIHKSQKFNVSFNHNQHVYAFYDAVIVCPNITILSI